MHCQPDERIRQVLLRDFKYRKDRGLPNFWEGPLCKHLKRAVRTVKKLERMKVIPKGSAHAA